VLFSAICWTTEMHPSCYNYTAITVLSKSFCVILLFLFTDCLQSWGTRSLANWEPPESYLQALSGLYIDFDASLYIFYLGFIIFKSWVPKKCHTCVNFVKFFDNSFDKSRTWGQKWFDFGSDLEPFVGKIIYYYAVSPLCLTLRLHVLGCVNR